MECYLNVTQLTCYTDGCLVSEPIMGGKAAKVVPCRADFPVSRPD